MIEPDTIESDQHHAQTPPDSSAPATPFLKSPGIRVFLVIWFGQVISGIGSRLTSWVLGVWIYQQTGSATLFALNLIAIYLPQLALSPVAGVLADRWDRRTLMILSDTGAGLSTLVMFLLYTSGRLEIWHVYAASMVTAACGTLQYPSWTAAQSLIVPQEHLGRTSGLVQMGHALGEMISPVLAGVLYVTIRFNGVVAIDFATYLFAVTALLLVRLPKPEISSAGASAERSWRADISFGFHYIWARKPLLGLLLYFATINFLLGLLSPMFAPMLLAASTPQAYGLIGSVLGVGFLLGTLVMSVWGGSKRRIVGLLGFGFIAGLGLLLAGVRFSIPLIAAGAALFTFAVPIIDSHSQALWQSKVEPDVQGRVFGVRAMLGDALTLPGLLLAGPLLDTIMKPLMAVDGPLAGTWLGSLLTLGPGRDAGLVFILAGFTVLIISNLAYLTPVVRHIDILLPDTVKQPSA